MYIIVKGKRDNFGKTRSEQEKNLRKEWGSTMSNEQLDKLKYIENKVKETSGQKKNFLRGQDIDRVK
jgi:hypothetical protein